MSTPLTDAINALTASANSTTGASDTSLSDAVSTLIAGYGGGGATNFVSGTFTGTSDTYTTINIPYTGNGYPVACMIYPTSGIAGNSTVASTVQYLAVCSWGMVKTDTSVSPTYRGGNDDKALVTTVYKYSSSDPSSYLGAASNTQLPYQSGNAQASRWSCVSFKSATEMSVYFSATASSYGLLGGVQFTYNIIYSS